MALAPSSTPSAAAQRRTLLQLDDPSEAWRDLKIFFTVYAISLTVVIGDPPYMLPGAA